MSALLNQLLRNPRVESVSVEQGGDFLMIILAKGWSRYGTGRRDGWSKGFDLDDLSDPDSDSFDPEAHVKAALRWVRSEVTKCDENGEPI